MKDLILKLSIDVPYTLPRNKKLNDISIEEIQGHLRDLRLNSLELRKELSWTTKLVVYESSANYDDLEQVKKNIKIKLKEFNKVYPYINDDLLNHILIKNELDNEKKLDLFKRVLKNELSEDEKKNNVELIKSWIVEIVTYNVMLGELRKPYDVKQEVFKYVCSKYKYLNVNKTILDSKLLDLGIEVKGNIDLFKRIMGKYKSRFKSLLNQQHKKEDKEQCVKEDENDLTESILGLFENMEEIEESEIKQQDVAEENLEQKGESKIDSKEIITNNNSECKEENANCNAVINSEEVYKNMTALAQCLGYELLDNNKVQVSKEYYEKLNSHKSEDEKIIKQLLSLEKGAILSQLYNTYKNLNKMSLDNIEAVMSNFFSALFDMGFEVNEDESKVGENITVNTKDLLKEFLFSKPISKDGNINGQVEYLSWNYQGKMIIPKIIKPIE